MMWVCGAGQKSIYADYYFNTKKIYIPWDGVKNVLREYKDWLSIKRLVIEEKGDVSRSSIAN